MRHESRHRPYQGSIWVTLGSHGFFCLGSGDKEKVPCALVAWIGANPDALKQPAGGVLQQALTARFPCKVKK